MGPFGPCEEMAAASSDLQWLCVRNTSSFLKKSNGATFTAEPNNLLNRNSFKYSGLVNKKSIGVVEDKAGCAIVYGKLTNKPAKNTVSQTFTKDVRRAAKAIAGQTAGSYFRADLKKAAQARAAAILKNRTAKRVQKTRSVRGRKVNKK